MTTDLTSTLRQAGIKTELLELAEYQRPGDNPIYLLRTSAEQAHNHWHLLRALVSQTGYWPVLGWDRFKQPPWSEEPTIQIIEAGLRFDVPEWLNQNGLTIREGAETAASGNGTQNNAISLPIFHIEAARFSFTPPSFVPISLIPTYESWAVPAFLRFSEDSQPPHIHVAVMKYWHQHWGAELVAWDSARAEMLVRQPPETARAAQKLAIEQFIYCPDVVEQVVGNVTNLARLLLNSSVWQFWWD